jgi:hypothetical protein
MKGMLRLAVVAGVMGLVCGMAQADGKALPSDHASMTNGVYTFTNTSGEPMYLDALDLKSSGSGTWTVTLYNGHAITNTLLSVAGTQVEWRTNIVNGVRLNSAGVLSVTTTFLGPGSNAWVSAYWSTR